MKWIVIGQPEWHKYLQSLHMESYWKVWPKLRGNCGIKAENDTKISFQEDKWLEQGTLKASQTSTFSPATKGHSGRGMTKPGMKFEFQMAHQ